MALSLFRTLDEPFRTTWPSWPAVNTEFGRTMNMMPYSLGACDVRETDKAVNIVMDAPGMTEDDVKVQLSEGVLTISGEVCLASGAIRLSPSLKFFSFSAYAALFIAIVIPCISVQLILPPSHCILPQRTDETSEEKERGGIQYHRQERRYGSINRQFQLPANVNAEKLEATFDDGVLNITIPKMPEKAPNVVNVPIGHNPSKKAIKQLKAKK